MPAKRGRKQSSKKEMMIEDTGIGGMWGCCYSGFGLIHFIGGVGVAFLLVEYLNLSGLLTWGWIFVIIAIIGHLMKRSWMW